MAIHSKYNPQIEADRFVESIVETLPDYIVITEPGKSYLAESFRKRFPKAKLIAIRYTKDLFLESDSLWDYVYRSNNKSLSFFLLDIISDEFFANTLFLSWKASEIEWKNESKKIWGEINYTIQLFKSLIFTRTAFGTSWLKNIFVNIFFTKNPCNVQFKNVDYCFLAAGFSLEQNWKNILKTNLPIICAGSSYDAAKYQKIPVTACITTDGSFWAKRHIKTLDKSIPIFFPLEAGVPKSILDKNKVCFLSYGSFLESYLFQSLKLPYLPAKRNGSIAGTAIELLLNQTDKNVFCFGLDLASGKSFSHVRPHSSLSKIENSTTKLNSLENSLTGQRFLNSSLKTYAFWFKNLSEKKSSRIFRVGLNESSAKISTIKNIENIETKNINFDNSKFIFCKNTVIPQNEKKQFLKDFLQNTKAKINRFTLEDIFYTKNLTLNLMILKELIEFTSYGSLINFIKEKNKENEKKVKLKFLQEMEKIEKIF